MEGDRVGDEDKRKGSKRGKEMMESYEDEFENEKSDDTSSIGDPSDDDEEREESDSNRNSNGIFASLEAPEEKTIPIKGGLSNSFYGRSKSFECLSDILEELVKFENPFNKRRKLFIIYNKRDFCAPPPAPPPSPSSPPPITINEEGDQ